MQVRFIRDCYKVAMKQRRAAGFQRVPRGMRQRLARMFNITPHMVKAIIVRRKWRHLP